MSASDASNDDDDYYVCQYCGTDEWYDKSRRLSCHMCGYGYKREGILLGQCCAGSPDIVDGSPESPEEDCGICERGLCPACSEYIHPCCGLILCGGDQPGYNKRSCSSKHQIRHLECGHVTCDRNKKGKCLTCTDEKISNNHCPMCGYQVDSRSRESIDGGAPCGKCQRPMCPNCEGDYLGRRESECCGKSLCGWTRPGFNPNSCASIHNREGNKTWPDCGHANCDWNDSGGCVTCAKDFRNDEPLVRQLQGRVRSERLKEHLQSYLDEHTQQKKRKRDS